MKKRGYIYVYAIFVIALIFMVVVSLTETAINKNRIAFYSKDYINQKYLTESKVYQAVDNLISSGFFESELIKYSRRNSGKAEEFGRSINYIFEDQDKFNVNYKKNEKGYLEIYFRIFKNTILHRNNRAIKLFNDLYYQDTLLIDINEYSEEYKDLQKSGYIDSYIDEICFLESSDKIVFTKKDGKFVYKKYTDDETPKEDDDLEEGEKSDLHDAIEDETEVEIINDNSDYADDETNTGNDTEINDDSPIENEKEEPQEQEESETIEEPEKLEDPSDSIEEEINTDDTEEEIEDKPEDWIFIEDSKNLGFVMGPNTVYSSDSTLILSGLIKMNTDTIIDSDLEISGVLILEGNPVFKKGSIKVTGAILTAVGKPDYITLIPNAPRFEKYASIYKGFIDPKVGELYFSY